MMPREKLYPGVVFPALERLDPETAHDWTLELLARMQRSRLGLGLLGWACTVSGERIVDERLQTQIGPLKLENPILIAEGFDKNGRAVAALETLGVSSVIVGTVTRYPQEGNDHPRIFRPQPGTLLNHCGFPGQGADQVAQNLRATPYRQYPLGISLGLNKDVPPQAAAEAYRETAAILSPLAHYLVINVSSPNTPGLRQLQQRRYLEDIVQAVKIGSEGGKPLLVKVAPDIDLSLLDEVIDVALEQQLAGIIAVNTSTELKQQLGEPWTDYPGGVSGEPLEAMANRIIRHIYEASAGEIDLIGMGGVRDLPSLLAKVAAGAQAVGLYTGLVYLGPTLPTQLNRDLLKWMSSQGISDLREIVGQQV